ncbi:MAG: metallophosphoesterase [Bacillota bacterium]|nr:metallophosphoesterase [Bacillota bacterium]
MKKFLNARTIIFSLLLLLVLLASNSKIYANPSDLFFGESDYKASGDNSFSFLAISDTHITRTNVEEQENLRAALSFAENKGYDQVNIVGDFTNTGSEEEYSIVANIINDFSISTDLSMGNHEGNTYERFNRYFNSQPSRHEVKNGYHFFYLSPGTAPFESQIGKGIFQGGDSYIYLRSWLESELNKAIAEDPTKPVFVFAHHPIHSTVQVSEFWFGTGLEKIFDNKPQVVLFSGHIHTPVNHPRNLVQDRGYTAVNTGTLSYFQMEAGVEGGSMPENGEHIGHGLEVVVNGSQVTIKGLNLNAGQYIGPEWSFDVTQELKYTRNNSSARALPYFENGAEIIVNDVEKFGASITIPQARIDDTHNLVNFYRVEVRDTRLGSLIRNNKIWSDYFVYPQVDHINYDFKGLVAGRSYTVSVYPISGFGLEGLPIKTTLTTKPLKAEDEQTQNGKIRFGVLSDLHLGPKQNREKKHFDLAAEYFNKQNLDQVVMVGDITDNGREDEYQVVAEKYASLNAPVLSSMGNHENDTADLFEKYTGSKANDHKVINGYHFITVSPGKGLYDPETGLATKGQGGGNYQYIRSWLKDQLDMAVEDNPDQPIFVFFHHPIQNTFYVSEEWHGYGLSLLLLQYPQVVSFSGHIHSPNNHPLSISQDYGYTAVNTVSLSYFEMESGKRGGTHPKDNDCAQGMIVEVEGNKVRINNYDFLLDKNIDQSWEFEIGKPLPYTKLGRRAQSKAPVFESNNDYTVDYSEDFSKALINFRQAQVDPKSIADDIVHSYRYVVFYGDHLIKESFKEWSDFYKTDMKDYSSVEINDLKAGKDYTVKIYPINAYGLEGQPLLVKLSTK